MKHASLIYFLYYRSLLSNKISYKKTTFLVDILYELELDQSDDRADRISLQSFWQVARLVHESHWL